MSNNIKVAIMQPYFLPYIGYWQLINATDFFVIYDDIKYTKKGWINRNRFLKNGKDDIFSLPLKKDSDHLDIAMRFLADNFEKDKIKILRRLESAYRKSPFFHEGINVVSECLSYENKNLFSFVHNSIDIVKNKLGITTEIIISSTLNIDKALKGQDRVIEICKRLNATDYINPIGGLSLYDNKRFLSENIQLYFQQVNEPMYAQFNSPFIHYLSIVDIIMFNGIEGAKLYLASMELINA